MDTRDVALTVLLDIETNQAFSNIALGNALRKNQFTDKVERAFLSRLVEGVTAPDGLLPDSFYGQCTGFCCVQ